MSKRTIEIIEYQPNWGDLFAAEQQQLQRALGCIATRIEHIGSTSVAKLAAKPIIDIQVAVTCLLALDSRASQLATLGYKAKGENGIAGRRYFQKGGNQRSHHLHIFQTGDANLLRHRAFKQYLINHPEIAAAYAEVKKMAAQQCQNDSTLYSALKSDFIVQHERHALTEFNNTGHSHDG